MDILSDIKAEIDRLESRLALVNWRELVASLPTVSPHSRNVSTKLPSVSAVYFLHNRAKELLYIGKAENLKTRWRASRNVEHDHLSKALKMDDVQLSWQEMEIRHLIIIESAFIRLWFPTWNVIGKRIPRIIQEREKTRKLEEERRRRLEPIILTPEEEADMNAELDAREQGIETWTKWHIEYYKKKEAQPMK